MQTIRKACGQQGETLLKATYKKKYGRMWTEKCTKMCVREFKSHGRKSTACRVSTMGKETPDNENLHNFVKNFLCPNYGTRKFLRRIYRNL